MIPDIGCVRVAPPKPTCYAKFRRMRSTYILAVVTTALVLAAGCAAPPPDRTYDPIYPTDTGNPYDAAPYDAGIRATGITYDAAVRDATLDTGRFDSGLRDAAADTGGGGLGGLPIPGGGGGGIPGLGGGGMGTCASDADCESGEVCCGIDPIKLCIGIPICPLGAGSGLLARSRSGPTARASASRGLSRGGPLRRALGAPAGRGPPDSGHPRG